MFHNNIELKIDPSHVMQPREDKSAVLNISTRQIKQIIDEYEENKIKGLSKARAFFSFQSSEMKVLKKFYQLLQKSHAHILNGDQILELMKIMSNSRETMKPHTKNAFLSLKNLFGGEAIFYFFWHGAKQIKNPKIQDLNTLFQLINLYPMQAYQLAEAFVMLHNIGLSTQIKEFLIKNNPMIICMIAKNLQEAYLALREYELTEFLIESLIEKYPTTLKQHANKLAHTFILLRQFDFSELLINRLLDKESPVNAFTVAKNLCAIAKWLNNFPYLKSGKEKLEKAILKNFDKIVAITSDLAKAIRLHKPPRSPSESYLQAIDIMLDNPAQACHILESLEIISQKCKRYEYESVMGRYIKVISKLKNFEGIKKFSVGKLTYQDDACYIDVDNEDTYYKISDYEKIQIYLRKLENEAIDLTKSYLNHSIFADSTLQECKADDLDCLEIPGIQIEFNLGISRL